MQSRRPETLTTHLIRAGFADLTRSASLWRDPDLVAVLDSRPKGGGAGRTVGPDRGAVELQPADVALLRSLAAVADPDLALLQLVRLAAAAPDRLRPVLAVADDGTEESRGDLDAPVVRAWDTPADAPASDKSVPDGEDAPRPTACDRLLRVLGASSALGDELVRHPALLDLIRNDASGTDVPAGAVRA